VLAEREGARADELGDVGAEGVIVQPDIADAAEDRLDSLVLTPRQGTAAPE